MEENKKIILPTKKFKNANEEELDVRLNLENNESLLRTGDKDIVLDVATLYEKERNESVRYKIYGKVKMIFKNLFSGTTGYNELRKKLYLIGDGSDEIYTGYYPYDEFAFLRRDLYRQVNNVNQGSTLGTFEPNINIVGNNTHQNITPIQAPYHNWNLYLSYVNDSDSTYPMKYTLSGNTNISFLSGDGIPFRVLDNGNYFTLISPIEHGIKSGEYVVLSGGTLSPTPLLKENTFYVNSVGDETYNSEKYVLNIFKTQFTSGQTISGTTIVLGKRCVDINNISGSTSNYYVHKHKTLTDVNEFLMDKIGFESPIFKDEKKILFKNSEGQEDVIVEKNRMESILFDFKNPFILSGLTNNLGYTPTDVYVSIIFRNGNGYFDYPFKVGYKFNFHDTWLDNHFSGTTSNETTVSGTTFTRDGYTFISGNTIPSGTTLTGAFVEYNPKEMNERIISESFHKLTIPNSIFDHNQDEPSFFSGASINNKVGLYYQPHYRVKLRQLSPYLETSRTNDVYNLPENTIFDEDDKLWKWRDLYEHGYIDDNGLGTDYPFVNGTHHVKMDINFYLRNEKYYLNKQDGITSFNNRKIDC